MFVPTPDRITRSAAVALGALALAGQAAQAMPMYDPANATSAQYVLDSRSDAAQSSGGSTVAATPFDRTDAAQQVPGDTVVEVRSSDRSDAAQRVPGETSPTLAVAPSTDQPTVVADDGFNWTLSAIAAGIVLMAFAASGALTSRSRRGLPG